VKVEFGYAIATLITGPDMYKLIHLLSIFRATRPSISIVFIDLRVASLNRKECSRAWTRALMHEGYSPKAGNSGGYNWAALKDTD
jgi:hypothetical protein